MPEVYNIFQKLGNTKILFHNFTQHDFLSFQVFNIVIHTLEMPSEINVLDHCVTTLVSHTFIKM